MKIGFSLKKGNIFSEFIARFTKSKWSHCFIITDIKVGNDYLVIESAFGKGVTFDLLSKFQDKSIYTLEKYEVLNYNDNIDFLCNFYGKSYGYLQMLGYLIVIPLKLRHNIFTSGIECSELVLKWLQQTKTQKEFKYLCPDEAVPEDLYEIIIKSPNFNKIT